MFDEDILVPHLYGKSFEVYNPKTEEIRLFSTPEYYFIAPAGYYSKLVVAGLDGNYAFEIYDVDANKKTVVQSSTKYFAGTQADYPEFVLFGEGFRKGYVIEVWNLETRKLLKSFDYGRVFLCNMYYKHGLLYCFGFCENRGLWVYDLKNSTTHLTDLGYFPLKRCYSYTPSRGDNFVICSDGGKSVNVTIWNSKTRGAVETFSLPLSRAENSMYIRHPLVLADNGDIVVTEGNDLDHWTFSEDEHGDMKQELKRLPYCGTQPYFNISEEELIIVNQSFPNKLNLKTNVVTKMPIFKEPVKRLFRFPEESILHTKLQKLLGDLLPKDLIREAFEILAPKAARELKPRSQLLVKKEDTVQERSKGSE